MTKVAALYYSQTGQGVDILQSVCKPLIDNGVDVVYKEVLPASSFPYPWTAKAFFEAFPESRQGIGCEVMVPDLTDIADAELVIVVYPVWFLSPSIPTHGFFQNEKIKQYLDGKDIITVCGCRNMWIMAQRKVSEYIRSCGGKLVGNIILQDRHHNLVSVITIIRWLIGGRKERKGIFPNAGVSDRDISRSSDFGGIICQFLDTKDFSGLQEKLMEKGAICYKPNIAFVEKVGHRIFGIWSKWILNKGKYGSPERNFRLKLFEYYLYTVLFAVSPIGLLVFYLTYPFRIRSIKRNMKKECYML